MEMTNPRTGLSRRPGAVVLGGNFVGLGIARSLGRHGIPVWVIDSDRSRSIAQFSRYTKRFIESKTDAHELLLSEGRKHDLDGWVLFPVNDEYVEMVSTNHRTLSSIYRLITPPLAVTKFALDKRLTYAKATELGIASPLTQVTGASIDKIADSVRYPSILKPAVNHHFFPQTNIKAFSVSSPSELRARYAQMSLYIPPEEILIQERIPGNGENQFSYCAVCRDGRVYAGFVAQRRRQYPVDFGNASSFVETVRQSTIENDGRRFLESIGFDGMAEVEFKYDPTDQQYKVLDVNPRPWGWHTLSRAAGVDFAYLLWQMKVGIKVDARPVARDAAWLREITDGLAILGSPNPVKEFVRLLKALTSRRLTLATFSLADPLPFFAEFALWIVRGARRRKKAQGILAPEEAI